MYANQLSLPIFPSVINHRQRLTIGEVLKHPWLTQPLPSPSSLAITSVLGVQSNGSTNQDGNSLVNKSTSGCGLITNLESAEDLVKSVHCETPSTSSSVGSLDDAEILAFTKAANSTSSTVKVETEDETRSAMETQASDPTQAKDVVIGIDDDSPLPKSVESPIVTGQNDLNESRSHIGRSQTAGQVVEVQDSSEDR